MESNSSTTDFSLLPPHVIAKIFKFLNFRQRLNASRTCKPWYYASCDPLIWKHSRIKINNKIIRAEDFHRPFGKLELTCIQFNEFILYREFFSKFGQYIRELDFNNCTLSLQQLYDCLILTPTLTSLFINLSDDLLEGDINLIDEQLDALKLNLNGVRSFAMILNSKTLECLRFLILMMPHLENLSLTTTFNFCYTYIYGSLFDYFNMFSDEINLNRLELSNLAGNNSVEFFRDFMKIEQKINVHELVLPGILKHRHVEYYEHFDSFCRKLSSVKILSMYSIGPNQLNHVCSFMTELTEIHFSGTMSDLNIKNIGSLQNLNKLTLLCLGYYNSVGEDYLLGIFPELRQLNELRLEYEVSQRLLNEICISCTNLTTLKLSGVQTTNFTILFKHLLLLKRLELFVIKSRLEFAVDYDITNLKFLEELEINSFAPGMTMFLIEQLPHLQPKSLLNIRNNLQPGYVDPELEDTYTSVSDLFN